LTEHAILEATRRWIDRVVVGLGLCPFAEPSIARNRLRMTLCGATHPEELSAALIEELQFLRSPAGEAFDSSLLIHPQTLCDFEHYNDYLDRADEILEKLSLVGVFQIASFHPRYRFAGSREDDPGNYTNRSPYPMLHLLREASVSRAIEQHPDPGSIPETNIRRLEDLGVPALDALLAACKSADEN
jgi:hypothetical protein